MRRAAFLAVAGIAIGGCPAGPSRPAIEVRMVADEAEAAVAILEERAAGRPVPEALWTRLLATEGFRRLQLREASLGRSLADSTMRRFLESAEPARAGELRRTLEGWRAGNLDAAGRRALGYLPPGATIRARLYPVIKPADNSFVFETRTDSAAIFLYLDPAVTPARLENTLAHELHHIGYGRACAARSRPADPRLGDVLDWIGAFGEGVAMLAAAGGPEVHPHALSDTADRARWDRDVANAGRDLPEVERFLVEVLDGRLAGDSATTRGMEFFGVQGPWYTVGYLMAAAIERRFGRARLVESICDGRLLLRRYDEAARADGRLPRWTEAFLERLGPAPSPAGR